MTVVVVGVVALLLSWFALDWLDAHFYDVDVLRECANDELRSGRYDPGDPDLSDAITAACIEPATVAEATLDFDGFRTSLDELPANVAFDFGTPDRWATSFLSTGWMIAGALGVIGVVSAFILRDRAMPWALLLTLIGLLGNGAVVLNIMSKDAGVLLAGPFVGLAGWALVAGGTLALSWKAPAAAPSGASAT